MQGRTVREGLEEGPRAVLDSSFPKHSRLLNAEDYSRVFKQTDFKLSNRFLLILAARSDRPEARLGLVIAKKNIAGAVQRNRIKRIIRESYRVRRHEFATIDMVVLVRRGLDQLDKRQIRHKVDALFDELTQKT